MKHTFNLDHSSIRLIVSFHAQKFKKATGLTIDPRLWDSSAKSLRAKCKDEKVYKKLRLIHLRMEEKEFEEPEDKEGVLEAIDYALSGDNGRKTEKKQDIPSFYGYFEEWADRDTPQKRQRKNTLKLIKETMGEGYDWKDIDTAFYFRLLQRLKDKKYSVNYIGSVVAKLKTVMSEGRKLKYHDNDDFHQFKRSTEDASTVWLTPKEVERIIAVKTKGEVERKTQDLFILGYYTAMRYSDYSRLTMENIRDGKIYLTQRKTAGEVVIPAAPRVVEVLKRNGGRAPEQHQMVFNKTIKTLAMRAKVNEKVQVTRSEGDTHVTEFVEKWTQIASHSCRRSAITALHLSGVPLHQLMMISGHRDIQSLQRYLRMTKEENANALKSNPFFK